MRKIEFQVFLPGSKRPNIMCMTIIVILSPLFPVQLAPVDLIFVSEIFRFFERKELTSDFMLVMYQGVQL